MNRMVHTKSGKELKEEHKVGQFLNKIEPQAWILRVLWSKTEDLAYIIKTRMKVLEGRWKSYL
jgi:hypothetical protein